MLLQLIGDAAPVVFLGILLWATCRSTGSQVDDPLFRETATPPPYRQPWLERPQPSWAMQPDDPLYDPGGYHYN